jgi:hypothetical protein
VATGVLRVAYRAHEDLAAVAFIDERAGAELVPGPISTRPSAAARLGRPAGDGSGPTKAFLRRLPLQPGPLRRASRQSAAPISRHGRVGPRDARTGPAAARLLWRRALSLDRYSARPPAARPVDQRRRRVIHGRRRTSGGASSGGVEDGGRPWRCPAAPIHRCRGRWAGGSDVDERQAQRSPAFAPVGNLGLGVVVMQPERMAFAAVTDLRSRLVFWIGVAALARWSSAPASPAISRGACASSSPHGVAGARPASPASDRPRRRARRSGARLLNLMADDLGAPGEILMPGAASSSSASRKKTAELHAAQELLLRARSLAAVGTLGRRHGARDQQPADRPARLGAAPAPRHAREPAVVPAPARDSRTQAQRIPQHHRQPPCASCARERSEDLEAVDLEELVEDCGRARAAPRSGAAGHPRRAARRQGGAGARRPRLLGEALAELVTKRAPGRCPTEEP